MTEQTLTKDELVFVKRMAFHVERGLSFEDAAQAVIDDDMRIFTAFSQQRAKNKFVPHALGDFAYDEPNDRTGDVIGREITRQVYTRLRAS